MELAYRALNSVLTVWADVIVCCDSVEPYSLLRGESRDAYLRMKPPFGEDRSLHERVLPVVI